MQSREITISLDKERMDALRKLAEDKGTTVEQLTKSWIVDRLRIELHLDADSTTAELQRQLTALESLISRLVPERQ